jgi:hypothetical protein
MTPENPQGVPPYGSSYAPPPPPPNMPLPYWPGQTYTMPQTATPPAEKPAPAGRAATVAWAIGLIVLVVGATALAVGARASNTPPPPALSNVFYASSLTGDDGKWTQSASGATTCSFTSGGLDVTASADASLAYYDSCQLTGVPDGDLRVSVRIASAAAISGQFAPVIFLHNAVAFVFSATGSIDVEALQGYQTSPISVSILIPSTWHGSGELPNDVVIANQGSIYTMAVNGAMIYQGDFGGHAELFSNGGALALGVEGFPGEAAEALYTDLSVTTP